MPRLSPIRLSQTERIERSCQALLDAAAVLVAKHGSTTVSRLRRSQSRRDIARVRFGSKLELMRALLNDEYQDVLLLDLPDEAAGYGRLEQLINNMSTLASRSPNRLRAAWALSLEAPISVPELMPDVEPWLAPTGNYLRKTLRLAIRGSDYPAGSRESNSGVNAARGDWCSL